LALIVMLGARRVRVLRRWRVALLVGFDVVAVVTSFAVMAMLRYEPAAGRVPWDMLLGLAAISATVHVLLSVAAKLYRGRAHVASVEETVLLTLVVLVSCVVSSLANVAGEGVRVGRSIPVAAAFMALASMLSVRAFWRALSHSADRVRPGDQARALVVGAGESGRQLVWSMHRTEDSPYTPVGFLDDDPWKRHLRVDGVPVQGALVDLETVVELAHADTVILAIPSATSDLIKELTERCSAIGIDLKVLPPVAELLGERVTIRDVRDINVADLLGRSVIETDIEAIAHFLRGKRVLITGAGGSIGSELARQIARWEPAELMMLDRDESGLHGVQLSIHGHALLDSPEVILCDIRDAHALGRIFDERRPEVVFHAAALKHLPMLEQYPLEAVKTNVIGTANVLEAARRVGVERFVNISTDKAADPTSILGFSKRAAERITADYAQQGRGAYLSVRFGNVLGSRGSVLTTFTGQIAQGGPVTVTHPDVTRYFMTVSEAVQLVLQAAAIGRDGEVLILDMGQPVRIDDVARELIRQSGRAIEIIYTGLREGEKLDEVLRSDEEQDHRPVHPLISHVRVSPIPTSSILDRLHAAGPGSAPERLRELCALDSDRTSVGSAR
jgi:FlaA1/EpsC-like NDP-sugar epimerase